MKASAILMTLVASSFVAVPSANAALLVQTSTLWDPNNNGGVGYVCDVGCTAGFEFTLTSSETIKALGVWDFQADGLNATHQVGLWDSGENLLASTTITNSSAPISAPAANPLFESQWLFNNIPDLVLAAGTYRLGMTQAVDISSFGDNRDLMATGPTTFNLNGNLGSGHIGGFNGGGTTLAYPTIASNSDGFYGANLSTTAVPIPAAAWLFGSGLLGLVGIARRKKA